MSVTKIRPYLSSENWREINGLRLAGETFNDAVTRLLEEHKKRQLHADMMADRLEDDYLPLDSIPLAHEIVQERDRAGQD